MHDARDWWRLSRARPGQGCNQGSRGYPDSSLGSGWWFVDRLPNSGGTFIMVPSSLPSSSSTFTFTLLRAFDFYKNRIAKIRINVNTRVN